MPDPIRQRVVDILKARYAAIRIDNGYQTDLGLGPIDEWPIAYQQDEMPATGIFDLINKTSQAFPREKRSNNALSFQTRIFLRRNTTPALARMYVADVMKATITDPVTGERDPTFGGLAIDTKPDEDGFTVPEDTFQIDGAAVSYIVEFLSEPFNAYE